MFKDWDSNSRRVGKEQGTYLATEVYIHIPIFLANDSRNLIWSFTRFSAYGWTYYLEKIKIIIKH